MFTGTGVEEPDLAASAPLMEPTVSTPAESVGDLLAEPETDADPETDAEPLASTGSDEESDGFLSALGGADAVALKPRSIESLLDDLDI